MQFTIISIIAAASMVAAAPNGGWGSSSPPAPAPTPTPTCTTGESPSCCNENQSGELIGLNCVLDVVSGTCTTGSLACCSTDPQTGLINIGAICAPISL